MALYLAERQYLAATGEDLIHDDLADDEERGPHDMTTLGLLVGSETDPEWPSVLVTESHGVALRQGAFTRSVAPYRSAEWDLLDEQDQPPPVERPPPGTSASDEPPRVLDVQGVKALHRAARDIEGCMDGTYADITGHVRPEVGGRARCKHPIGRDEIMSGLRRGERERGNRAHKRGDEP